MSPFSMVYCLRNVSYNIVAFVTQYHIFENQPLFYDKLFPFNIATQTPPPFSKPFPGIYLFALQIDKCHSSFKKVPIQKLIIKIFTDLPVLGTEHCNKTQRYLPGVLPKVFLKTRVKYPGSANPQSWAASLTRQTPSCKSFFAASSLTWVRYSRKV